MSNNSYQAYSCTKTIPFVNYFQPSYNMNCSMNNSYDFFSYAPLPSVKSSQPSCYYPIINQILQKGIPVKRTFFTEDEDKLLSKAAIKYNQSKWNLIAKCVPGKTPKQCRDRWANYLQPSLKFEPWTKEEEELLLSLVSKNGTHWSKLSAHFPTRSTNSIKNRWYWLINNKEKDKLSKKPANDCSSDFKCSSQCVQNNSIINPNNIHYNPFNYGLCPTNFSYDNMNGNSVNNNFPWGNKENPNNLICTLNNNQNIYELKTHTNSFFIPLEDDEIITFSPEELNW